jgi:hypothetical protein
MKRAFRASKARKQMTDGGGGANKNIPKFVFFSNIFSSFGLKIVRYQYR